MKRRCSGSLGALEPEARGGTWKVLSARPPGCMSPIALSERMR
jgi:hypothetical protein